MRAFIKKLAILATILAVVLFFVTDTTYFQDFLIFTWVSWVFLTVLTAVVFFIYYQGMKMEDQSRFMGIFGVSIALKFFGSLVFLAYFIFIDPIRDHNFIMPFFAMYFLYSGLMMWEVWSNNKQISK